MLEHFRGFYAKLLTPGAKLLSRLNVSPDTVSWIGTILVCAVALGCVPQGFLWQGSIAIGILVLTDGLDGQLARITGKVSSFGAFLDSSLDRIADGLIFGSVLLWFAKNNENIWWVLIALIALVAGQVTSYVKARAESVGFSCRGGIAARADRLLILLVGMFLAGIGILWALKAAMLLLACASIATVAQRMIQVYRQAQIRDAEQQ
ncbi:MAG: phosphatidylinositol phosphate synthase [Propionibacteriaceae bacterium]